MSFDKFCLYLGQEMKFWMCKLPYIYISTSAHRHETYVVQGDTCGLIIIIYMLSLTCTVLYSRHHPWVSRLHAGLKGVETSFIALTADLETTLQLSSSSLCLQSNVALMSSLTITSAGIVVCTLSGPQEGTDCVFYSKTISTCKNSWRPEANFCL